MNTPTSQFEGLTSPSPLALEIRKLAADKRTRPVVEWIPYLLNVEVDAFDELGLLIEVENLLKRILNQCGGYLPREFKPLSDLFEKVIVQQRDYQLHVLPAQAKRLQDAPESARLARKDFGNADRGLSRVEQRVINVKAATREEFLAQVPALLRKRTDVINERSDHLDKLDRSRSIQEARERIFLATRNRMNELGIPFEEKSTLPPATSGTASVHSEFPAPRIKKPEAMKDRSHRSTPTTKSIPDSTQAIDAKYNALTKSVTLLKELIEAAQNTGEIIVIVPHIDQHAQRFTSLWQSVLDKLGYKGKVRGVTPNRIERVSNKSTPILVAYAMSGVDKLRLSQFSNSRVIPASSPNLIKNHIDETGSGDTSTSTDELQANISSLGDEMNADIA